MLGIHDASSSSALCTLQNYPLSPICSCHPPPSAMLPMLLFNIPATHILSFPLCIHKFSPFLSCFRADKNGWNHPPNFACLLCSFRIRFVSIGQWDQVLMQFHNQSHVGAPLILVAGFVSYVYYLLFQQFFFFCKTYKLFYRI